MGGLAFGKTAGSGGIFGPSSATDEALVVFDGVSGKLIKEDPGSLSPTFTDLTLSSPSDIYGLSHDSFADFEAAEHIDWTVSQSPTVIHADNYTAGEFVEDGSNNLIGGTGAGASITTATNNFIGGVNAGTTLSSASNNVIVGSQAGRDLTTDPGNVIIGYHAAYELAGGNGYNVVIGQQAGNGAAGSSNYASSVLIGYRAGNDLTTGGNSVVIGHEAGQDLTTNAADVIIGRWAGRHLKGGNSQNVVIGYAAGTGSAGNSNYYHNTLIGFYAGNDLTSGASNVCVGYQSGEKITSDIGNVCIGQQAGDTLTTGGALSNICIGYDADVSANNASNQIVIGHGAAGTADNQVTLGNSSITSTLLYGNVTLPDGKYVATDTVRAIDGDGLGIKDDGGNGPFIADGGSMVNTAQPAFLVYNSSTDTNVTGDETIITVDFDGEIYDQGGDFATDTFTAPVKGKYLLHASVMIEGLDSDSYEYGAIFIDTSNRTYIFYFNPDAAAFNGAKCSMPISVIADMDALDTVVILVKIGVGTKTIDVHGDATIMYTYFSGSLIC